MTEWADWIGRTHAAEDVVTPGMVEGLRATLDHDGPPTPGAPAPQGIHWLVAPTRAPMHALGPDGHPARGDFMPPIPLPRRMWAASDIRFFRPIATGDAIAFRASVAAVTPKSGSSGALVFVELDNVTSANGLPAVSEHRTIVFREAHAGATPPPRYYPEHGPVDFERRCTPGPVMLFRYSALTFNGHRIHYDQPYATQVEGYPGLVVHGPLTATLLLDLCGRQFGDNRLSRFAFRAVGPAFAGEELRLAGRVRGDVVDLTASVTGRIVMRAEARLA